MDRGWVMKLQPSSSGAHGAGVVGSRFVGVSKSGSDKDVTSGDGGGGRMLENRGGVEGGAEHGAAPCLRGGRAFWTAGVRTRLRMDASLGNVL